MGKPLQAKPLTAAPASPPASGAPAAGPAAPVAGPAVQAPVVKPAAKPAAAAAAPSANAATAASAPAATPAAASAATTAQAEAAERKSAALAQLEELEQVGKLGLATLAPSWLVSLVVHLLVVLIMGLIFIQKPDVRKKIMALVTNSDEEAEPIEEIQPLTEVEPLDLSEALTDTPIESENIQEVEMISDAEDLDAAQLDIAMPDQEIGIPVAGLTDSIGAFNGSGLQGRGTAASRAQLVAEGGGTAESERAVALALKWLAAHQYPDGGWSFDHRVATCQGQCGNMGSLATSRNAATGLALLPFLGAGNTHKEGEYKQVVQAGLYFLIQNMKVTENGGDLQDASGMYSHGIASIALCEAYAMTQDKGLMQPAQAALNFIMYAQDPVGGGWRYGPRQAGDTSVVGWQLMALKSGHMAYLQVHPLCIKGAENFLNTVQTDSGAAYGYDRPGAGSATSAIGLLCRMYLGWEQDEPALQRGVAAMSAAGPALSGEMYYNYYATQVMHHQGGEMWEKWNTVMRDFLVAQQAQQGHETGSWFFGGGGIGSEPGGRVYCTAMSTMVLEVYYRHMPIYQKQAAEEEFGDFE